MSRRLTIKIKSQSQIYFFLALFSFLLSAGIWSVIFKDVYPNKLVSENRKELGPYSRFIMHDFNYDGYSEMLAYNREDQKIVITDHNDHYIDQINITESILTTFNNIIFNDFNSDGFDDIIIFSKIPDSLYFNIYDVKNKDWIYFHELMIWRDENSKEESLKLSYFNAQLVRFQDGAPYIIFSCRTSQEDMSSQLILYDIKAKRIVRKYNNGTIINSIKLFDLNNDSSPEILMTSSAFGQNKLQRKYPDNTNWLFVVDKNFNEFWDPKNFGIDRSEWKIYPITVESENLIFVSFEYTGYSELPDYLFLYDSKGKILKQRKLDANAHGVQEISLKSDKFNLIKYQGNNTNTLSKYDLNFHEQRTKVKKDFSGRVALYADDLDFDGNEELIYVSRGYIIIYNSDLKIQAVRNLNDNTVKVLIKEGGYLNKRLILRTGGFLIEFRYAKNYLFTFSYIVLGLIWLTVYLFTVINFWFFRRIYLYLSFVVTSLVKTDHGILILNHDLKIVTSNTKLEKFLGLNRRLDKGNLFSDYIEDIPEIRSLLNMSENGDCYNPISEELNIDKKNVRFKGEMSLTPFCMKNLVFGYLFQLRDFTEPVLSDRLKTWSRSVQKMAHEIKQPLSTIALNIKMVHRRLSSEKMKDKEMVLDNLSLMKSELDRIRNLTGEFLKFVNLDKPVFQNMDINEIISEVLQNFDLYKSDDLTFEINLSNSVDLIEGDIRQIEMAIQILTENAIDAMGGKGNLRITTNLTQNLDGISDNSIQIEISDSGPGIPKEDLNKIFEPFFTTKESGTGIGLAIVKKIVEDHWGDIKIYSEPGLGTTFTLIIPVNQNLILT